MSPDHLLSLSRRTRPILIPRVWTQTTRSATTQPTPSASTPPPEPTPPPPTAMIYDRLVESVKYKLKSLENPDRRFLRYASPHPIVTDYTPILSAPETKVTTLPNGLRVATESNLASKTAATAVWVDAGSRYEADDAEGVAHLLEHMVFKGTKKMDEKKLGEEVENMGGTMNACTTREQTEYSMKVMMNNADNAIEILADALQNSLFDEKKLEREKGVILQEREQCSRKDEDVIFDQLHATAFQYTSLGRSIIGSMDNFTKITKAQIQDYMSKHYATHRVVISAAGAVKHEDIVEQVKKHFSKLSSNPETASQLVANRPAIFTGSEIRMIDDDLPIAQFAVAFEGASWTDPDSIALMVMKVMLGSWSKKEGGGKHTGSDLVQRVAINEIAESMGAFNLNYKDTGLFGVYAEAKPDCLDDLAYSIMYEMSKFCYRVSEADVTRACNQLKSSLLLVINGSGSIAEDIGFQLITYGRRIPFAELFARIDAVDADTVKRVANRFIFDQDIAIAAKGPIQSLPDYNWFRRRTYWLRY